MEKNIPNNKTNSSMDMENAFYSQNKLMDELIKQMYNYDLYGRYKDTKFESSYNPTSIDLSNSLNINIQSQNAMLDSLASDAKRIQKTYNYNSDMYRNQVKTNTQIKKEKDIVEQRYNIVTDKIRNNQKQNEIYQYYYYKGRAQLKIIKTFIVLIIVLIFLTFLNKKFNFAMNDSVYSFLVGLLFAVYVIYTCKQLYDIYLRSEFVFDEYDRGENPGTSIDLDKDKNKNKNKNKKKKEEKCKSEWDNVNN